MAQSVAILTKFTEIYCRLLTPSQFIGSVYADSVLKSNIRHLTAVFRLRTIPTNNSRFYHFKRTGNNVSSNRTDGRTRLHILGIKMGGLGVGLAGGLGLAILTLGFGLEPSAPAVNVILIIMAVVTAASTMQAAGGMDWLVHHAGNLMRRNPKYICFLAPMITWLMTIMAGTGYTVFSTLPVISEVAKEIGVRPSRPLAGAVVASQVAISGSPISAAMAAMISIMEPIGVSFLEIMAVCLPASFIAAMVGAFIASRQGCELKDDPVYLTRLQQAQEQKQQQSLTLEPKAKYSVMLFLLATIAIVIYAAFPVLRPHFADGSMMSTRDIIIVSMFAVACLMVPMCKVDPEKIIRTTTFRSGMSSVAVILGIVTMGSTMVNATYPKLKSLLAPCCNPTQCYCHWYCLALAPYYFRKVRQRL